MSRWTVDSLVGERALVGRLLSGVTEARHWHDGERGGDVESLLHFWLHFEETPALMAQGKGDALTLDFSEPYTSYDMQEYGEVRVGPAAEPDLLAALPGRRLLDVSVTASTAVFRFEGLDFEVSSVGDGWVLACRP